MEHLWKNADPTFPTTNSTRYCLGSSPALRYERPTTNQPPEPRHGLVNRTEVDVREMGV
jgi:hypothetical protein